MVWVLIPVSAYMLGSIPFGRLIGIIVAHVDVRKRGSFNIGATNVAREVGVKWGALTLVLDALKGAGVVVFVKAAGFEGGLAELCGFAAVIGHQFSVFQGFRGGKGVSTALGVFLALEPAATLAAAVIFLAAMLVFDMVSVGSICWCCSLPAFVWLFGGELERIALGVAVGALIIVAHRENIRRIIRGKERRWKRVL